MEIKNYHRVLFNQIKSFNHDQLLIVKDMVSEEDFKILGILEIKYIYKRHFKLVKRGLIEFQDFDSMSRIRDEIQARWNKRKLERSLKLKHDNTKRSKI